MLTLSFNILHFSMGHDVSPVGNHQLDMSSTEALARDISERFQANVKYGYQDVICCDPEGNKIESTFDVIIQGTIKDELNTHFKETTLHIPGFMKERKPLSEEEFPLAFFDNFLDL